MHRINRIFLVLLSVALLGACARGDDKTPSDVGLDPNGEGELLPEIGDQPLLRERRRMDLDQLNASIRGPFSTLPTCSSRKNL